MPTQLVALNERFSVNALRGGGPQRVYGAVSLGITVELPRNSFTTHQAPGTQSPKAVGTFGGNGGMAHYTGFFEMYSRSVWVYGLRSCVGLVAALRSTGGEWLGEFMAFHFGGGGPAWQAGFQTCAPLIRNHLLQCDPGGARRRTLVAVCGPQHPRNKRQFEDSLNTLATAVGAHVTTLFWLNSTDAAVDSVAHAGPYGSLTVCKDGMAIAAHTTGLLG